MKVFIDDIVEEGEVKGELCLEADSLQFFLVEYRIAKEGKNAGQLVQGKSLSYPTIHGVLQDVLRRKVKESTATTLQGISNDIRRIEDWIKSKFETELKEGERVAV